jgi:hypothetical protein
MRKRGSRFCNSASASYVKDPPVASLDAVPFAKIWKAKVPSLPPQLHSDPAFDAFGPFSAALRSHVSVSGMKKLSGREMPSLMSAQSP